MEGVSVDQKNQGTIVQKDDLPPPSPTPSREALAPKAGVGGYEYEFSGLYTWGDVITSLCAEGYCRVKLPREFYSMRVPLSVYENSFDDAFKALSMQASADGYILIKTGRKKPYTVSAELDKESVASYVSCLDTSVKAVKASDLVKHQYADSLRCLSRSLYRDSLYRVKDTLLYPSRRYRVSFYVVSSSYLHDIGVDWVKVWASGDLFSRPELITDWALSAVSSNDSTAEFRSLEVDLDSAAQLHWGSQKKEEKGLVVYSTGVSQNDYEWKNYGLTLTMTRDKRGGLRARYELSQRDENNSVLRGEFGGGGVDSISAFGVYDSYQDTRTGVPFLSNIPYLGELFSIDHHDKVKSFFVIQVYPVRTSLSNFRSLDSLRQFSVEHYQEGR